MKFSEAKYPRPDMDKLREQAKADQLDIEILTPQGV